MTDSPLNGPTPPEPNENGLRAFETVWRFLEEDGLKPRRVEGQYVYHVNFVGQSAHFNCFAVVRPDLEQFMFYAVVPVKADDEVRHAVVEFITRANYGLRIGNFEMDYTDGEVRYMSGIDFEGVELQPQMVRTMVHAVFITVNHYLQALLRVMYGGLTPVEAILEVERASNDTDE